MALQRGIRRTPMPLKYAVIIQRNFTFLEEHIDAKYLLSPIFRDGIIEHDEMSPIEHLPSKMARNKALLTTLLVRGDNAWKSFINALRERGFETVANKLICDADRGDAAHLGSYPKTELGFSLQDIATKGEGPGVGIAISKGEGSGVGIVIKGEGPGVCIATKGEGPREGVTCPQGDGLGEGVTCPKGPGPVDDSALIKITEYLEAQVKHLSTENNLLHDDLEVQKRKIDDHNKEIGSLKEQVQILRSEKKTQSECIQVLTANVAELETKISDVYQKLEVQQKQNTGSQTEISG